MNNFDIIIRNLYEKIEEGSTIDKIANTVCDSLYYDLEDIILYQLPDIELSSDAYYILKDADIYDIIDAANKVAADKNEITIERVGEYYLIDFFKQHIDMLKKYTLYKAIKIAFKNQIDIENDKLEKKDKILIVTHEMIYLIDVIQTVYKNMLKYIDMITDKTSIIVLDSIYEIINNTEEAADADIDIIIKYSTLKLFESLYL